MLACRSSIQPGIASDWVAGGKIFSTRACRFNNASPNACVITAHDATTGKELWRRRTIPRPGEPGDETWGNLAEKDRRHVGAWMTPSYDAELNLLYVGIERGELPRSSGIRARLGGLLRRLPRSVRPIVSHVGIEATTYHHRYGSLCCLVRPVLRKFCMRFYAPSLAARLRRSSRKLPSPFACSHRDPH